MATQKTVANRVTNLLGKSAGAWTEAQVRTIDRKTRRGGPVRERVNRLGHQTARRVIGTAPAIGIDELISRYLRAIDRVAMAETADIAVIGTGFASKAARENNAEVERMKLKFNGTLERAARQKHLHWIDSVAVTQASDDPEATFSDPVHKGQQWHDGLADAVAKAFLKS
ncbi:MAG: hypothetical protein AB7J35_07805 [Dehalococcoidia bacterium]